jgi:hypothetical protein
MRHAPQNPQEEQHIRPDENWGDVESTPSALTAIASTLHPLDLERRYPDAGPRAATARLAVR